MIKQCVICGKEFSTNRSTQKICSSECRRGLKRQWDCEYRKRKAKAKTKTPKKCVVCGKEFIPKTSRYVACSPECSRINNIRKIELNRRKIRERDKERINEDIPYKPICYTCGKSFVPAYPREHFCSDKCRFQSPLWIHLFEPKFTNQIIPF